MKAYLVCLMISVAISRCSSTKGVEPTVETLTIRSGTAYGYCIGYCQRTLVITGTDATFTKSSNQVLTQYPPVTCKSTLTDTEWENFKGLADLARLQKQPKQLGCPDCADGGAEFLEIEQGSERYRVTFEAGRAIPGFDALVTALREKRKTFDKCN